MRLIHLEIDHFRVIRRARLALPDHIIGVIGPNGAGKSSLIEAVAWALYGNQAARTGREEIKAVFAEPGDICRVRLEFQIHSEKYTVERRLVGKSERAEVELFRGESSESVGVNETKAYVGQLLGLDWKGFLTSFLARQQELNALSDLQAARRQDHLAAMLGIEKLDRAIKLVKDDTRILKDRVGFLERQTSSRDELAAAIKGLEKQIGDNSPSLAALETRHKEASSSQKEASQKLEKAQAAQASYNEHKARLNAAGLTVKRETERLESLTIEKKNLDLVAEREKALAADTADWEKVKAEVEKMRADRSKKQVVDEWTKQLAAARKDQAEQEKQSIEVKSSIDEYRKLAAEIPTDIEERVTILAKRIEEAIEEYRKESGHATSIERDIARLKKQLGDVDTFGPESVCERCHRPLGEDLQKIKGHLNEELANLAKELKAAQVKVEQVKTVGSDLRKQQEQVQKQAERLKELSGRLKAAEEKKQDLGNRIDRLGLTIAQFEKDLEREGAVVFDTEAFARSEKLLQKMQEKRDQMGELRGKLSRVPDLLKQMGESEKSLAAATAERAKIEKALAKIAFSPDEFEATKKAFSSAQQEFEKAREELSSLRQKIELWHKELAGKQEQMAAMDKATAELEESRVGHFHTEKLSSLFGQFRKHLIATIRPTLADSASRLIAEMTNGKYNLIELDEQYNLSVFDSGQYFGIDRFSGGEKDLANLCLRMAISQALTESAGLDRSFVILDEVFGSQDVERRELIVEALKNLKQSFPQVLLVTHIEELKDRVEDLIEVKPTPGGYSEVYLNGALT